VSGPGKLRPRVNRPIANVAIAFLVCMTTLLCVAMFLHVVTREDVLTFASYVAVAGAANSAPGIINWFRSKPLEDGGSDPPPSPKGGDNADS